MAARRRSGSSDSQAAVSPEAIPAIRGSTSAERPSKRFSRGGVADAGKSADRSSEKTVVWRPEKDQVLPPRYLALLVMFSYRTCAGILLFSKSTSGPKGGQANFPNHAGFSCK